MVHLYLINDNENTFNYVWAALMKHVKHDPIQAEQCCMITDNNGRCHIKSGEIVEMTNLKRTLIDLGLNIELRTELHA
jgi:hypothetical protein